MAIEIINKLKRKNRILLVIIIILSMVIAGMVVHYKCFIQREKCVIENVADIPQNTVYVSKRKIKKDEHNKFYKNRTGLF